MRRTAGIALISVLLVMLGIVVLGIGTLFLTNSSLMVSQNLISHSVARSNAESGIDVVVAALREEVARTGRQPATAPAPAVQLQGATIDYQLVTPLTWDDNLALIRTEGRGPRNARFTSEAVIEFVPGGGGGMTPYSGVIQTCENLGLSGSGRIDSFDSRQGPYSSSTARRNAMVRTLNDNGNITLNGNAPIWGDVYSTGSITATGSSSVLGNMFASGDVILRASTSYDGSITAGGRIDLNNTARVSGNIGANGNITFTNGAVVSGNASSGGNISFTNTGARVQGNALARGTIGYTHNNHSIRHVGGHSQQYGNPVPIERVPPQACDPLDLRAQVTALGAVPSGAGTVRGSYPRNQWRFTPTAASHYDETWNVQAWTAPPDISGEDAEVFGNEVRLYRLQAIDMTASSSLHISGGDVVLLVDGNVNFSGSSQLHIDPDSSLTLIVRGSTHLSASFRMNDIPPVNSNNVPAFSIYSTVRQEDIRNWPQAGVAISGNGKFSGTVYAPYSTVSVTGSGELSGAVLGRNVEVPGGAAIHYDEALANVEMGGGGGGTTEASIVVLSRR